MTDFIPDFKKGDIVFAKESSRMLSEHKRFTISSVQKEAGLSWAWVTLEETKGKQWKSSRFVPAKTTNLTIDEIARLYGFNKPLKFKCTKQHKTGFAYTEGEVYSVIVGVGLEDNISSCDSGDDSLHTFDLVVEEESLSDHDNLEEEIEMSLWDSMEEIEGLDRGTAKVVVYQIIFKGNLVEIAKEHKLSLAQLSEIVVTFNKFTGAE